MNKKIFAANWKLNKTPEESREFVIKLKNEAFKFADFFDKCEVIIFPQAFSLEAVYQLCAGTAIGYGPQNIYSGASGAFTGENSANVAKSLGSKFALVGHSERRSLFAEEDTFLNKKNKYLQELQMTPVFCIGESLKQREDGQTWDHCKNQLDLGLAEVNKNQRIIVAYEPIWAIGTGKVASVQQVAEVHKQLFEYMKANEFTNFQLLYGGSVKPENSEELLNIFAVDGFLIGGASLEVGTFMKICGYK